MHFQTVQTHIRGLLYQILYVCILTVVNEKKMYMSIYKIYIRTYFDIGLLLNANSFIVFIIPKTCLLNAI